MSSDHDRKGWQDEREAVVEYLYARVEREERAGNDHEARIVKGLAQAIERGRHRPRPLSQRERGGWR